MDAVTIDFTSAGSGVGTGGVGPPAINLIGFPIEPPLLKPKAFVAFLRITKLPTGRGTGPNVSLFPEPGTILTSPPLAYFPIPFFSA